MKNILIVGTGAMATLFAGRLAVAGSNVTLLGSWAKGIDALNKYGARLVMPGGEVIGSHVKATGDPSECLDIDMVFVLVKAWQTERVVSQLVKCLPGSAVVVTLQNGLGNREILAAHLGSDHVILGVTTTGATLLEPGLVRMAGEGMISLEAQARSAEVLQLLKSAGMNVEIAADADALIWGKLVVNTAINPLTAILGVPNGILLEKPAAREVMGILARETASVAFSLGIKLPYDDPVAFAENVALRTAENHSSMLQDIERGLPTEIDSICGAVARIAENRHILVPLNWTMWKLVSSIQQDREIHLNQAISPMRII